MKKLIAIMLVLCPIAFGQNQKPRFVVSVSGELNIDLADVLADEISYAIIKSGKYDLLANDRQFKDALKKEWKNGNVDDDKIIAIAQKAGADYICFAKIKSLLGSNQITAQLVDLKTMLYGSMGKANGTLSELDHLTKVSQAVVADMLGFAISGGIGVTVNTFTDSRDGKQYKMVKIGTQTWMAENLNYNANGSKCYDNEASNCKKYGRLYDWNTSKKACPEDWHLPSKSEWDILVKFAGGKDIAGKKLKSAKGWKYDDKNGRPGNGTDDFGFSALPGGFGENTNGWFGGVGIDGGWWGSSGSSDDDDILDMKNDRNDASLGLTNKKVVLLSVRCVQD